MINIKNIIPQGGIEKYQIIIDRDGFSMTENDFRLRLTWGMQGKYLDIPKTDMFQNEGGTTFFSFDTSDMVGRVTAECTYYVPDSDYADGVRKEVERQPLCWVNAGAKMPSGMCDTGLYDGRYVTYIRQTRSGLRSLFEYFICAVDGILRDVNGLPFLVRKRN